MYSYKNLKLYLFVYPTLIVSNVESYLKYLLFLIKLSFSDTTLYRRWQGKDRYVY